MPTPKPILLLILDGWGDRPASPDNAIALASTPHWDALLARYPTTQLITHGQAVGLPEGQMGNSEVGHMNIGAGRIVYQDLTRLSQAIKTGEFATNKALLAAMAHAKQNGGTLHIFGLLSPGGVHSHEDHFFATIEMSLAHSVPHIALHVFTDGRDVAPRSALPSLGRLERYCKAPSVKVASVSGRYFAMDRDNRWERTQCAWNAIAQAQAVHHAATAQEAVEKAYAHGQDDEFIEPVVIGGGCPIGPNDAGIFINFRSDRARQLSHALTDPTFNGFDRGNTERLAHLVTMTQYEHTLPCDVAFAPEKRLNVLGEVVAKQGKTQLRLAETEKYAHVTYFFNGGQETVFSGEDRTLIPSPKVATYDLQPEMSAPALGRALSEAIINKTHDLIVANLANPDMVGHTGDLQAAIAAVEAVDEVIGQVRDALEAVGGEAIITADHGNAEQMIDAQTGQAHTAHTTNLVPLVYLGQRDTTLRDGGSLRDIAPTLLDLLELDAPKEMTGRSLLVAQCD